MSITQSLFDIVLSEAEKNNAKQVLAINVVVGELTGIVPEHLEFYFNFLKENTIAKNAKLNVALIPIEVECMECKSVLFIAVYDFSYQCPSCNSSQIKIAKGKELFVKDIEIE